MSWTVVSSAAVVWLFAPRRLPCGLRSLSSGFARAGLTALAAAGACLAMPGQWSCAGSTGVVRCGAIRWLIRDRVAARSIWPAPMRCPSGPISISPCPRPRLTVSARQPSRASPEFISVHDPPVSSVWRTLSGALCCLGSMAVRSPRILRPVLGGGGVASRRDSEAALLFDASTGGFRLGI